MKRIVGRTAELVLPELAAEIDEVRNVERAPRLKRAILYARLRRAHERGDVAGIESALESFWKGGPGDSFHGSFAAERLGVFRERHAVAIDVLAEHIAASEVPFTRLVEIGCGDGKVLADCADKLPSVSQAIGIDINAAVIDRASIEYASDARLAFVNADAVAWLAANPQPGTVMLSNGGVLEYFSPENVDSLLKALALARPAAAVLIEPAAPDHDLEAQPESYVFGREYSFSHNHRHRLSQAGFRVVFEEETKAFGHRLMMMVAVLDPAS